MITPPFFSPFFSLLFTLSRSRCIVFEKYPCN